MNEPTGTPTVAPEDIEETAAEADKASRRWRAVWRTHFYAGILAAPVLVLLAITGLVIMYTQPINDALDGSVRTVTQQGEPRSYDDQLAAAEAAYPKEVFTSVVTPIDRGHATAFGTDSGTDVFVDPYTLEVLGDRNPDGGIVGLANRLHGTFNNESVTIPVPTLSGALGPDPLFSRLPVGDLLMEIFACWALILAASGIYLWWPRKAHEGKALLLPRITKKGRARWRDLHAIPGFLFSFVLAFMVISGLPWSGYWGANFSYAAEELTPGAYADPPASSVAALGDLDRFGNKINWALKDAEIPASDAPVRAQSVTQDDDHDGHGGGGSPSSGEGVAPGSDLPAQLSLNKLVQAGYDEGLLRGYALTFPSDVTTEDGTTLYGSYAAANPWPNKSQNALTVYFDQFTGETLGRQELYGVGTVSKVADYAISTHMGTQFGLINRVVMTGTTVVLLWSVITAFIMYGKRRRKGSLGLPRRPRELKMANRMILISVLLGLLYPLWGLSAIVILGFDKLVIQRRSRLRATFGQRFA